MEAHVDFYIMNKQLCLFMEHILDQRLKDAELTTSQGYLLYYICHFHPTGTNITALHKEMGLSMAALSGNSKKLRQKGFLSIDSNSKDERQKKLILTQKAQSILQHLEIQIQEAESAIYQILNPSEKETLFHLEDKVVQNISKTIGGQIK